MNFFEVIEDAPIGILKTDRQLQIKEANPPALILLGLNPDEYKKSKLSDFFKGEQRERFSSMFSDPEATPQKSGFLHEGNKRRKIRISVSISIDSELIWYLEDRHESWTLEQEINACCQAGNDLVLACHHDIQVQLDRTKIDPQRRQLAPCRIGIML